MKLLYYNKAVCLLPVNNYIV